MKTEKETVVHLIELRTKLLMRQMSLSANIEEVEASLALACKQELEGRDDAS